MEPTRSNAVNELLDRAAKLDPLVREHADEAERERRLSKPVTEALREAGFFRMFRPLARGGLELDPVSTFRVIEALAHSDSASGWNVQIANASEPFGAWFPSAVTREALSSEHAVMAGAFNPPRRAVPVEGGYRLSGKTPFNSNCHSATCFIGLASIYDGDAQRLDDSGAPVTLLTLFPSEDARIIENWDTLGMCGTGSHDVSVEEIFVPEERAVPFLPLTQPSEGYEAPLHRLSVWPSVACQAAPSLGIAQAALDDLVALGMKVPAYTQRSLRNRAVVQLQLAQAAGKLGAARAFFHATYGEAWRIAQSGRGLEMRERAKCQLSASHAVTASAEAIDLVHACVGASGIRNDQRFQKYFRDIHVITQHAFVCASRLEAVGQVMLDLEPDWPFFQF
jgi:alkylation response protein AidB-like acyl-CoA dehydrogenase